MKRLCTICWQSLAIGTHADCITARQDNRPNKPMTPDQVSNAVRMFVGAVNKNKIRVTHEYKDLPNGLQCMLPKAMPARRFVIDSLDELYIVAEYNTN